MYEVFMLVDGIWESRATGYTFSDSWDFARCALGREYLMNPIHIVGPEGSWSIK